MIQKSDLREFIPEMFYLPDLFFNKNNINVTTYTNFEKYIYSKFSKVELEEGDTTILLRKKYSHKLYFTNLIHHRHLFLVLVFS